MELRMIMSINTSKKMSTVTLVCCPCTETKQPEAQTLERKGDHKENPPSSVPT